MKQLILQPIPAALRFRRWSRKGYAAFISLQRAVTIGQLSTSVSERFQAKNLALHAGLVSGWVETAEEEDSKSENKESLGSYIAGAGLSDFAGMELKLFLPFPVAPTNLAAAGIHTICPCPFVPTKGLAPIQDIT